MHTVTEDALHEAQAALTEALGITVEGAAGASWAGLLVGSPPTDGAGARHHHRQQRLTRAGGGVGLRMAGTRNLPFDVRDLARSLVPIVLLSLGAAVPRARFAVLFVIAAGTAIAVARDAPVRWTWAGAVPVAVSLFWGTFATPVSGPSSSIARIRHRRSPCGARSKESSSCSRWPRWRSCSGRVPTTLYLRLPARRWWPWAIFGFLVTGPIALVLGPYLARPFFGDVSYTICSAPSCRRSSSRCRMASWRRSSIAAP